MKTAHRTVPCILLVSLVVINAFAHSSAHYQSGLTDADKQEILSVLFEQELATAQNETRTILMSPGTNTIWLMELPGIRFKQLTYEEEKQVSEYYELRDIKIKRDFVEVWLSKGNYCKKAGSNYQFRKQRGIWKFKSTEWSESFGSGTCAGCKTGSGSVYRLPRQTAHLSKTQPRDLLLTGKALAIRCRRGDKPYIPCEIDLGLDFSNRGNQPIIILQPHGDYAFWQGGRSLALTKADSEANNYVYKSAAWPSFSKSDEYRRLAVENFKPDLGGRLRERWKKYGNL